MLDHFASDVRQGLRRLRRRPGFGLLAVATLGLGVGVNAAIFSLVNGILLAPLPFPHPEQLVRVWASRPSEGILRWGASLHDYEDWRNGTDAFAELAAYNQNTANLAGIEPPRRIEITQVTPSFFRVLGIAPALGRTFTDAENQRGQDRVVVLSHRFWARSLGSNRSAVGRVLNLDGAPVTVVGVMPAGFAFPSPDTDLWKPFGMVAAEEGSRGGRWVSALARLRPGESLDRVRPGLDALASRLALAYPDTNQGYGIYLEPLLEVESGGARPALLALWGAVGLILLIAGANLANLLMVRAVDRSGEIAVRAALGATRGRLLAQLLAESLPLSALSAVAGALIAFAGGRALAVLGQGRLPRLDQAAVDGRVLAYSVLVAGVVGTLFSLLAALASTRSHRAPGAMSPGRHSPDRARVALRDALVVAQLALAVLVAVGAGLLLHSFERLLGTSPGFDTAHLLTLRVAPSWKELPGREQAAAAIDRVCEAVRAIPGVEGVGAVNRLPLSGNWWVTSVWREGQAVGPDATGARAYARVVTPGYLDALGLPLLRGRRPGGSDAAGREPVVTVNQALARALWPGADPLGRRLSLGGPVWYTVVGLVGDERPSTLARPPAPVMYIPFRQATFGHFQDWGMSLLVRTRDDPAGLAPAVVARVREALPAVPVYEVSSFRERVGADVAEQRWNAQVFTAFAALALLLASVGVYGTVTHTVARRVKEIGLRMALGATRSDVVRMVLGRGLRLATTGAALGLFASLGLARLLRGLLYGLDTRDPLALGASAGLLIAVALLACAAPALRATRIAPVRALRED